MTKFKDYQIDFFNKAQERFGRSIISKTEALELASEMGRKTATWFVNPKFRVARNQFQIPAFDGHLMMAFIFSMASFWIDLILLIPSSFRDSERA